LFPALVSVLGSWKDLERVNPLWFVAVVCTGILSLVCFWNLQRIALRTKAWFPVATSQLSSGAMTSIIPGGQAAGAALQFKMLTTSGIDAATAGSSITALSLLTTGTVLALPVLALPAILTGTSVPAGLASQAAWLGAAAFVFLALGTACLLISRPLPRDRRHGHPEDPQPSRTEEWTRSPTCPSGSSGSATRFDGIDGSHPRGRRAERRRPLAVRLPSPLLVAPHRRRSAPRPIARAPRMPPPRSWMIPVTPGGLGFVEGGLTATRPPASVAVKPSLPR
jgi:hypothetical protein